MNSPRIRSTRRFALLGLVAIASSFLCGPAQAAPGFTVFTNRANFLNAAAGAGLTTTNEDFSSNPGNPFTIDDLGGNSVTLGITGGFYSGVFDALIGSATDPIRLSSTSVQGSVAGIGFDFIYSFSIPTPQQSISLNGAAATALNNGTGPGFLGLLSTDGMLITSVDEILLTGIFFDTPRADNMVIATGGGAATVPEPSSLALFGMGSLSLLGYGWRRRCKSLRQPA